MIRTWLIVIGFDLSLILAHYMDLIMGGTRVSYILHLTHDLGLIMGSARVLHDDATTR